MTELQIKRPLNKQHACSSGATETHCRTVRSEEKLMDAFRAQQGLRTSQTETGDYR